jgi:hypothetical protein
MELWLKNLLTLSLVYPLFIHRPSSVFSFFRRRRRAHRHAPVMSHFFLRTMSLCPRVLCPFVFLLCMSSIVRILIFKSTKTWTPPRSSSVTFVSRHHVPVYACLMSLCILSLICRPSCPYFHFLEDEDVNTATLRFCHICFSATCPCVRVSYVCVFFTLYLVHRPYFYSLYVVHRPYFNF